MVKSCAQATVTDFQEHSIPAEVGLRHEVEPRGRDKSTALRGWHDNIARLEQIRGECQPDNESRTVMDLQQALKCEPAQMAWGKTPLTAIKESTAPSETDDTSSTGLSVGNSCSNSMKSFMQGNAGSALTGSSDEQSPVEHVHSARFTVEAAKAALAMMNGRADGDAMAAFASGQQRLRRSASPPGSSQPRIRLSLGSPRNQSPASRRPRSPGSRPSSPSASVRSLVAPAAPPLASAVWSATGVQVTNVRRG